MVRKGQNWSETPNIHCLSLWNFLNHSHCYNYWIIHSSRIVFIPSFCFWTNKLKTIYQFRCIFRCSTEMNQKYPAYHKNPTWGFSLLFLHDQATYISKKSTKVVQNKTRKLRDFLFISANKFSSSESFLAVDPSMGKDFVFSSLAASLSNSLCEIPFQA